jgi:hypothetical protein
MARTAATESNAADHVPVIRSPALIGRDQELAVLTQALAAACPPLPPRPATPGAGAGMAAG